RYWPVQGSVNLNPDRKLHTGDTIHLQSASEWFFPAVGISTDKRPWLHDNSLLPASPKASALLLASIAVTSLIQFCARNRDEQLVKIAASLDFLHSSSVRSDSHQLRQRPEIPDSIPDIWRLQKLQPRLHAGRIHCPSHKMDGYNLSVNALCLPAHPAKYYPGPCR